MPKKKKVTKKDKRPITKLMCTECKQYVTTTRKNPTNTPDRLELRKYCPVDKKTTLFKETK